MDGVVTLLPEPFYTQVELMWADLDRDCDVRGILATPVPHFSWHVAREYDREGLKEALQQFCQRTAPFQVQTAGLGIFTGEIPVVYAALVKNRQLMDFHEQVWRISEAHAYGSRTYYAPDAWMPHITLVFQDVCVENLECIGRKLFNRDFYWQFSVNNLALIGQAEGAAGSVAFRVPVGGEV